jgi:cytochrome P450
MRRMLAPAFSAQRMRALSEHIDELARGCLDDIALRTNRIAGGVESVPVLLRPEATRGT